MITIYVKNVTTEALQQAIIARTIQCRKLFKIFKKFNDSG